MSRQVSARICLLSAFMLQTSCAPARVGTSPAELSTKWSLDSTELKDVGALRFASFAAAGRARAVVGYHLDPANPASPAGARPKLWIRGRGMVPLPAAERTAIYKLAYDRTGALHALWATFAPGDSTPLMWITRRTELWHSRLGPKGWDAPTNALSAFMIGWGAQDASVAFDTSNRLHVIVSVMDTSGYRTVSLRRDAAGWSRRQLARGGTYTALATQGDAVDALTVSNEAVMQPARVHVRRSEDGGDTWSPLVAVSDSAKRSIQYPRMVASGANRYIVWTEFPDDDSSPSAFVATSVDKGRTWSRDTIPIEGLPRRISAAADGCGGFIALLEIRQAILGAPVHIFELSGRAGSTPRLGRRFDGYPDAVDAELVTVPGGAEAVFLGTRAVRAPNELIVARRSCK